MDPNRNQVKKQLDEILELSSEKASEARAEHELKEEIIEVTTSRSRQKEDHEAEAETTQVTRQRTETAMRKMSLHYLDAQGLLDTDDYPFYEAAAHVSEMAMLSHREYRPEEESEEEEETSGAAPNASTVANLEEHANEHQSMPFSAKLKEAVFGLAPAADFDPSGNINESQTTLLKDESVLSFYDEYDNKVVLAPDTEADSHPDSSKWHTHRVPRESLASDDYHEQPSMDEKINSLTVDNETTLHPDHCDVQAAIIDSSGKMSYSHEPDEETAYSSFKRASLEPIKEAEGEKDKNVEFKRNPQDFVAFSMLPEEYVMPTESQAKTMIFGLPLKAKQMTSHDTQNANTSQVEHKDNQGTEHNFKQCQWDVFCEKPTSTSERDLTAWHTTEHPVESDSELDEYRDDFWHGKSHFVDKDIKYDESNEKEDQDDSKELQDMTLTAKMKEAVFEIAPLADLAGTKDDDLNTAQTEVLAAESETRRVQIKEANDQPPAHNYNQCQWDIFCEKPLATEARELQSWHKTEHPVEADFELEEYRDDFWHGKTHHAPSDENIIEGIVAMQLKLPRQSIKNPVEIQDSESNVKSFLDRKMRQSVAGHPYGTPLVRTSLTERKEATFVGGEWHKQNASFYASVASHSDFSADQLEAQHNFNQCQWDIFCEKPTSTSERDLATWHKAQRAVETDLELDEYRDDFWHGKTHYAPSDENIAMSDRIITRASQMPRQSVQNPVEIKDSEWNVKSFLDRKLRKSTAVHLNETLETLKLTELNEVSNAESQIKNISIYPTAEIHSDYSADESKAQHNFNQCQWDVFCEKPTSTSERDLAAWHMAQRTVETDLELDEYRDDFWHGKTHFSPSHDAFVANDEIKVRQLHKPRQSVQNPLEIRDSESNIKNFLNEKLRQSVTGHLDGDNWQADDHDAEHNFKQCQWDVFCEKPTSTSDRDLTTWQKTERPSETERELDEYRSDAWTRRRTNYTPADLSYHPNIQQEETLDRVRYEALEEERRKSLERGWHETMNRQAFENFERHQQEMQLRARIDEGYRQAFDRSIPQHTLNNEDSRIPTTISFIQHKILEGNPRAHQENPQLSINPKLREGIHFSQSTEMMTHKPHGKYNELVEASTRVGIDGVKRVCQCALKKNIKAANEKLMAKAKLDETSRVPQQIQAVIPGWSRRNDESFAHRMPFPNRPMTAMPPMMDRFPLERRPMMHQRPMPGNYHEDDDGYRNLPKLPNMMSQVSSQEWISDSASFAVRKQPSFHNRVSLGLGALRRQVHDIPESYDECIEALKQDSKLRKCKCFLKRMSKALRRNRDDDE